MKNTIIITELGFCIKKYELFLYEEYADHENFEILISNLMMTSKTAHRVVRKY